DPGGAGLGGQATTAEALKAARYAAAVQYETLFARQQELLVNISLKRGEAELIEEARLPTSPVSPHPKRDAFLGMFAGLLLGVGASFLREQLNDRLRSADEVGEISGLPVLARLPLDDETMKGADGVAVVERPNSPLAEAVRSLRTSIQYLAVDQPIKLIVVTSSLPGEGKSLVAANLAVMFAQADYRTLLVSADLRRSSIDELFGQHAPSPGLTGVIAPVRPGTAGARANGNGRADRSAVDVNSSARAVVKTPVANLLLLPSGPTPPNPAELLGSGRMSSLLAEWRSSADVVIIDTPPLLAVTDAAVLAARSDGVVLVAAVNETKREALKQSMTILEGTGARLLGVVANKVPNTGQGGYYYAGYYGGAPEPVRKGRVGRLFGRGAEPPARGPRVPT
ncbi:MAG: AAA family ATPase, partial [Actinomycetota bacterium]|nr:AAA family ATPase [Actinomycetota bacterium]